MSAKDQVLQLVNYFKKEPQLKDKTDAMGDGLLLGANLADEANERSKEATDTVVAVQDKYKEQILAQDLNPNKDPELVDLRNGEQTAGERIAKFENKTFEQLSPTNIMDFKPSSQTLWKEQEQRGLNPIWFGAVGDGEADDTIALQKAIDALDEGQHLLIPSPYRFKFTEITFNKINSSIIGNGGLLAAGKLMISFETKTEANVLVSGVIFKNVNLGGEAIQLKNARRVNIEKNIFINKSKCIYVAPDNAKTTDPTKDDLFHYVSMINISNNSVFDCDQFLYVDHSTDTVNDVVPLDKRWMRTNDIHMNNNFMNNALINFIWARGLDGIIINGNTVFTKANSPKKSHIIYIGKTDWFIANGNNLFEAGLSAIYIDDVSRVNINGNNLVWAGQKEPSSAVLLGGYAMGSVANNVISSPTRYGVEVRSSAAKVVVNGNMYEYNQASVDARYYGDTTALANTVKKFLDSKSGATIEYGNFTDGQLIDVANARYKDTSAVLKAWTNKTFAATTSQNLFKILDSKRAENDTAAGLVILQVKHSNETSTANSGTYVLLVSRSVSSGYNNVSIISKGGLAASESTVATNHPRFNFSVSNGNLVATPLNATAGTYYFDAITMGNISLGIV